MTDHTVSRRGEGNQETFSQPARSPPIGVRSLAYSTLCASAINSINFKSSKALKALFRMLGPVDSDGKIVQN